jgi:uncharacterized protein YgbK (DUF1537 family)
MPPLLGCIADDFTGATDLAAILVERGMRTVLVLDRPDGPFPANSDAIVVALKSRTIPAGEAVDLSLAAVDWLRRNGCQQIFFKYCSTFDSTPQGNIGPVADALMQALGTEFTVACPAFPENGRTVFQGHLFVGADLLSDSGMRNHPLTPMTDANLRRVLGAQTPRSVGLIDLNTVRQGAPAVQQAVETLREQGMSFAIADAITNDDLDTLGRALAELPLLTGASGLARGLPDNFRRAGLLPERHHADALPLTKHTSAVIAGSCSLATQAQVAAMATHHPAFRLDPALLRSGEAVPMALEWARAQPSPFLIYSTGNAAEVAALQTSLAEAGAVIEETLATITRCLVRDAGVRRLIIAGGETSGAAVKALGLRRLQIGPTICPGVPWTAGQTDDGIVLAVALKSGNFGAPDFFLTAWERLAAARSYKYADGDQG